MSSSYPPAPQEKERLARAELRVAEEAQDRLREEQRAVLEMSPGEGWENSWEIWYCYGYGC